MNVKIPKRLRNRPLYGSHVVPYTVMWVEGKPDFRVTDTGKWKEVVLHRLCGLCGRTMRSGCWFVGGERSIGVRLFYDPPMHHDCAEYALRVCPFLAMKCEYSTRAVKVPDGEVVVVSKVVSTKRPERFGLAFADGFQLVNVNGETLILADSWSGEIEWWVDGKRTGGPENEA